MLREGHGLRVFKNKWLRKIFLPTRKKEKTTENCVCFALHAKNKAIVLSQKYSLVLPVSFFSVLTQPTQPTVWGYMEYWWEEAGNSSWRKNPVVLG
jgi:hypothetical protein